MNIYNNNYTIQHDIENNIDNIDNNSLYYIFYKDEKKICTINFSFFKTIFFYFYFFISLYIIFRLIFL